MKFDFSAVKEKTQDILEDTKEGISMLDRFMVSRSVSTRTMLTDTKNDKKLADIEDSYTREYSLLKVLIAAVVVALSAAIVVIKLRNASENSKKLREQKRELKRIHKMLDAGMMEIPQDDEF